MRWLRICRVAPWCELCWVLLTHQQAFSHEAPYFGSVGSFETNDRRRNPLTTSYWHSVVERPFAHPLCCRMVYEHEWRPSMGISFGLKGTWKSRRGVRNKMKDRNRKERTAGMDRNKKGNRRCLKSPWLKKEGESKEGKRKRAYCICSLSSTKSSNWP
jgi:hypothetical protein